MSTTSSSVFLFLVLLPFEAVQPHMGTLIRIKLYAENQQRATSAFRAAFDRIRQLDEILSDYKPASELNTICRTAVRRSVKVSDDLFRVLAASEQIAEESGGAFDITLGPVIRLWRAARAAHKFPEAAVLAEAGKRCGYRKLHLNARDHSVTLDQLGMQLDLGGIAKGYAADEALVVITHLGIGSALVAASGDLAFSDAPPGQRGWKIGLAGTGRVVELTHAAVSTSGDAEQHLDSDDKRYSHIIDPATKLGLTTGITVSIVAAHGIEADALSTAVSVLGVDRGLQLIEKHPGTAARIVVPDGHKFQVMESTRFGDLAIRYD